MRFVWLIVTRGWAESPQTCTDQPSVKPCLKPPVLCAQQSALTSSDVDMLELKRNPGQFGKQEDWAAGLGVQVQIEFHCVWRLQKLSPGSLWVFQSSLKAPAMLGLPRNSASQRRGSAAFKDNRVEQSDLWPRLNPTFCKQCWDYHRFILLTSVTRGSFNNEVPAASRRKGQVSHCWTHVDLSQSAPP